MRRGGERLAYRRSLAVATLATRGVDMYAAAPLKPDEAIIDGYKPEVSYNLIQNWRQQSVFIHALPLDRS